VDFSDLNEEAELIQKKLLANESDGCLTFLLLKNLKVHVRIVNRKFFQLNLIIIFYLFVKMNLRIYFIS